MEQLRPIIEKAQQVGDISPEMAAYLITEEPMYEKFKYVYTNTGGDFAERLYGQFRDGNLRYTFESYMRNYVLENCSDRVTSITNISREYAKKIINSVVSDSSNVGAGELGRMIASELRTGGAKIATWRARMIARTEVATASNVGQQIAAENVGQPMVKIWLHSGGRDARVSHEEMHNKQVPLTGFFDVGGEKMYTPCDPSASGANTINCRCGLGYKVIM
jgi:uncharacterized protein with gpF-like domain